MVLKLDDNQQAILHRHALERFLGELLAYCERRDLDFLARIGKARHEEIIRRIVQNAQDFGLSDYAAVCVYMDLTWTFGWHFESDPQHAWVPEIVEEYGERGQIILREALYDRMIAEQAATLGPYPETEYRVAAVRAVLDASLLNLPVWESSFTQDMLGILRAVWPQKFDRIGAAVLENACTCWREKLRTEFQYSTVETQTLAILCFYMLGHDFWQNPLYEDALPKQPDAESARDELDACYALQAFLYKTLDEELAEHPIVGTRKN
jgi:hypothetical protein